MGVCLCIVWTLQLCLNKFQIYSTSLLTMITMLNMRSPERIHHVTEVCSLWPASPIVPTPTPWKAQSYFLFCLFSHSGVIGIEIWISISMVTYEAEHIFIALLVTCISFLVSSLSLCLLAFYWVALKKLICRSFF